MAKAVKLEAVVAAVYGADALTCEALVIEWAAERLAEEAGLEVAARQWRRVNGRRHALGRYTTIPAWGSKLWAAYFGR